MISAMMPGLEHVIQIGDHQQLRPQIGNRSLSMEVTRGRPYQLDRSQFERLATGQPGLPVMPLAQLSLQRRMRPEISALIRTTMYPRLVDHEVVKTLPDVVGMRQNVLAGPRQRRGRDQRRSATELSQQHVGSRNDNSSRPPPRTPRRI